MRRLCILLLIFTVVAGCAKKTETTTPPPSSSAKPKSLTKVSFQTDWHAQAEHGGFYQALVRGYYKDVGLDVEILPGATNTQIPHSVGLGHFDPAILYNSHTILPPYHTYPHLLTPTLNHTTLRTIRIPLHN